MSVLLYFWSSNGTSDVRNKNPEQQIYKYYCKTLGRGQWRLSWFAIKPFMDVMCNSCLNPLMFLSWTCDMQLSQLCMQNTAVLLLCMHGEHDVQLFSLYVTVDVTLQKRNS